MKTIGIIALFIIALSFASCSSSSSSNSGATIAGTGCGKVLSNLYSQYKSTGKVDMGNSNTLLSAVELAGFYSMLNANKNDATYKKDFAVGLVEGSGGLILSSNSASTVNSILALSGLSSINSSTPGNSNTAIGVASQLIALFKTLK